MASLAVIEPKAPVGAADRTTPPIANAWYVVAFAEEVSRTPIRRWVLERDVLLYRTQAGAAVAMQNRCAHRSFPLHNGTLDGDAIVCGYHGMAYGADGRCVRVPADDREAVRRLATLRSYPVVEAGPLVWIWTGDGGAAGTPPETPWLTDRDWAFAKGYSNIAANYLGLHENLLDTTHFGFLHAGNVGTVEYALAPAEVELGKETVRIRRVQRRGVLPALYDKPMGLVGVDVDRHTDSWYMSPGWHVAHAKAVTAEGREYRTEILHGITPERAGRTHYFWAIARDYAIRDEGVTRYQHDAIVEAFEEDRLALEWIEEIAAGENRPFREISSATDRAGLHMRRLIAKLAAAERTPV